MKKILLLGAGYANISFIKNLPASIFNQADFTLISETPNHYASVLLHEVVSGAKKESVLFPIKNFLPKGVHFIQDKVQEITKDSVRGALKNYEYDILIVGLGFQSDDFNIPGIKEYTTPIVNYENALKLHEKILKQVQKYKNDDKKALEFAICGGGFSGIELIASLYEEISKACRKLGINTDAIKLTCIEAMPNILPMFSSNLIQIGTEYLKKMGITIATHCKILECQEDGVIVEKDNEKQKIYASMIIWTAGVKGNAVIENSPFFHSIRSKVEINNYLQPLQENMQNIFILGDCAALKMQNGRFYPPTAQMALQQGKYLAEVFDTFLQKNTLTKEFSYQPKGTICSLGEHYAIGIIGEKEIKGKIALLLKKFVEFNWSFKLKGFQSLFDK